jgi:hypothetical protein
LVRIGHFKLLAWVPCAQANAQKTCRVPPSDRGHLTAAC